MSSGTTKTKTGYWNLYRKNLPSKTRLPDGTVLANALAIRLKFSTLEEAQNYATANGLAARVEKPRKRKQAQKSYADNFRHDRISPWSH